MPVIKVDFEAYCGICGHGTCLDTEVDDSYQTPKITVTCSRCEDKIQNYEELIEELQSRISDLDQELREAKEENRG
jgi:transcription initiation factor IIE alpha subunit